MIIPPELEGRVCKTKIRAGIIDNFENKIKIIKENWPIEIEEIFDENLNLMVVLIFESSEDCLAFKLKHGEDYV